MSLLPDRVPCWVCGNTAYWSPQFGWLCEADQAKARAAVHALGYSTTTYPLQPPQPIRELDQLLAMFARAEIPFQRFDDEKAGRIEITVAPERREEGEPQTGSLTGPHWASTDYYFSPDGQLRGIWMEGD